MVNERTLAKRLISTFPPTSEVGQQLPLEGRTHKVRFTSVIRHWWRARALPVGAISGPEQEQQTPQLLGHVVGAQQKRCRHVDTERLSPEI